MSNKPNNSQIREWFSEVEYLLENSDLLATENELKIHELLDKMTERDPDNHEVMHLRKQLASKIAQQRERRVYAQTLKQCQFLWNKEQELVKAQVSTSEILETCYREAVRLTETATNLYPESNLLHGLKQQANVEYNQARNRYEVRTTAEQTGDFRSMLEIFANIEDKSKLIPWVNLRGEEQAPVTVAEAMSHVEVLAVNYAEQKAQQYLQEARQYMANSAPRAAKNTLLRSNNLFMLDDESKSIISHYLQSTVESAIQKLEEAERLLKRAEIAPNPEEGWHLLEQAIDVFPHLAELKDVRINLIGRMLSKAEDMINALYADIKFNHEEEITKKFRQASNLTQVIVSLPQDEETQKLLIQGQHLREQITQLTNTFENYKRTSQRIYALLGRGRQFLDSEDYEVAAQHFCEARDLLSEVTDAYISPADKVAIIHFCDDTSRRNNLIASAITSLIQAENAIQKGDACTAFDILLRIPKFDFVSDKATSLQKRIEELRETVLKSCAKKLASAGNFQEAETKLTLSSNPQKAIAEVISQREREMRLNRWDENLASVATQVNTWFKLSIGASSVSLIVLIVGLVFLFMGQVSTGIITTVSSIVPSFITKIILDRYQDLRVERQALLQKPTHEIDLESEVWQKLLETQENNSLTNE